MRRFFLTMSALVVSTVAAGTVDAQITLVPGPTQLVPQAPQYITAADFDKDGRADIAVNDNISNLVTVLLSGADRQFKSATSFNVGRSPQTVVAGDLNADGVPDMVVIAPFYGNSVFFTYGKGDGTFTKPQSVNVGSFSEGAAIGNFDGKDGNDIVVSNSGSSNVVTLLLNQGGEKGFVVGGSYPAGRGPRVLATGDLNGDGFDDVVVTNTQPVSTSPGTVSVMLNTTHGSLAALTSYVVGPGPKGIAIADLNGDGAPDILVLNAAQSGTVNVYSVSVLLNRTTVEGGQTVGTGSFMLNPPISVTCPSNIGGVLIQCSPNAITAGDFNNDGLVDFAVSFFTAPIVRGLPATAGLISAYQGSGDGGFAFATSVPVGLNPYGLVTADFTGDGVDDIGVAELGSHAVRVLRSIAPPRADPGSSCLTGRQCESGACVDRVCCTTATCPIHQFCNIPGSLGTCSPPSPNGGRCDTAQQCASGNCVDGFCCSSASCPSGQFCNTGDCQPPSPVGTPCAGVDSGAQCQTGFCVNQICCSTATCPLGQSCNIPGSEGTCTALNALGVPCTDLAQCDSGNCTNGVCCDSALCPTGQFCNLTGQEGTCASPPTPTPTPSFTPTPTLTITLTPSLTPTNTPLPQPNGSPCASGAQCVSGSCANATCCNLPAGIAQCPAGQRCDMTGSKGTCTLPFPQGHECSQDADCQSGNCDASTVPAECGPPKTATPTATATATATSTPEGPGDPCGSDADCRSNLVCNTDEFVCCNSLTCPPGESCAVPGSAGTCAVVPTPTPTKLSGAQQCNTPAPGDANPCQDGLLCNPDNGVCCEEANCNPGQRCDIFGFPGQCMDPLQTDEQCEKNTDCAAGLLCLLDAPPSNLYHCEPPPTMTPTLIPTAAQPTAAIQYNTSRSGGCSIGDAQDPSAVWLFGGLSLVLWARRYRRVVRPSTRSRSQ